MGRNRPANGRINKYRAKKTEVDGIVFASKREAEWYMILRRDEQAGKIRDLKLQVPFKMIVNGMLVCTYLADYVFERDGRTVVADAKGFLTREYRLKKKLMKACHGHDIQEL